MTDLTDRIDAHLRDERHFVTYCVLQRAGEMVCIMYAILFGGLSSTGGWAPSNQVETDLFTVTLIAAVFGSIQLHRAIMALIKAGDWSKYEC